MSLENAKRDFTEAQRIKSVGYHYHVGHRADFYAVVVGDALRIYVEETRERADWKDNFDFIPVYDKVTKAFYHKGFHINAMLAISKLSSLMIYNRLEIYSYSQGAAVAQIVADHLHVDKLITFGCPNNVIMSRKIKLLRKDHKHYIQGFDLVAYGIFWMKKYGKVTKLPGRGNPIKSHEYYWLGDKK